MTTAAATKGGVDLGRVRAAVEPVLSAHGVALVDLEWTTGASGWTLRVTIERDGAIDASGNVTLDDCAEVSRDVSQVLDVEDLIAPRYSLEVSSPGLERPLKSRADFTRFQGKLVKAKLKSPAPDGQRVLRGVIEDAPESSVAITVDGKRIEVPYASVSDAHLVFELTSHEPPKSRGQKPQHPKKAKR